MSLFKNANNSIELSNSLRLRFLKICLKSLDTVSEYLLKLVQNGPDVWPGAKMLQKRNGEEITLRYYLDRNSIVLEEGDIVHRHMMDGDIVLFNRQPSLHRASMMGHEVKVMKVGDSFRINVGVTKSYNADFDGDKQ
mgnify:CR=1 FL=1